MGHSELAINTLALAVVASGCRPSEAMTDASDSSLCVDDTCSPTETTGGEADSEATDEGDPTDPCAGPEVLLYGQPGFNYAPGALGGTYPPDPHYIQLADDFLISAEDQCWCVTEIVLIGNFNYGMLAGDLHVGFHDGDDLPLDPPIFEDSGVPLEDDGHFTYTLSEPAVLAAGRRWISALPELEVVTLDGSWHWRGSMEGGGNEWAMKTDYATFSCGDAGWAPGESCYAIGFDDLAFEIHGSVGGEACPQASAGR